MERFVQGVFFGVFLTLSLALVGQGANRSDRDVDRLEVASAAESANADTRTGREYDLEEDTTASRSTIVEDDQDPGRWATPECGSP